MHRSKPQTQKDANIIEVTKFDRIAQERLVQKYKVWLVSGWRHSIFRIGLPKFHSQGEFAMFRR